MFNIFVVVVVVGPVQLLPLTTLYLSLLDFGSPSLLLSVFKILLLQNDNTENTEQKGRGTRTEERQRHSSERKARVTDDITIQEKFGARKQIRNRKKNIGERRQHKLLRNEI